MEKNKKNQGPVAECEPSLNVYIQSEQYGQFSCHVVLNHSYLAWALFIASAFNTVQDLRRKIKHRAFERSSVGQVLAKCNEVLYMIPSAP